jgi:DNA polymerase-3 subunit epsilon
MTLTITKPLCFFDLETTGTDIATDRIVEISIVKLNTDGTQETYTRRVNPTIPISSGATAVHGITDADVANEPTFKDLAGEIFHIFNGTDIAGYNILRFDIPLLVEEMLRAGAPHFPVPGTKFVDAMSIFYKYEPRDLTAALKFYCNRDHTNAHSAEADVLATADILKAQIEKYNLDGDMEALHQVSTNGKEIIDYAGKFTRDENGDIVFAFGKNKGIKVIDDPQYVNWMLSANFTHDTKQKARQILNGDLA